MKTYIGNATCIAGLLVAVSWAATIDALDLIVDQVVEVEVLDAEEAAEDAAAEVEAADGQEAQKEVAARAEARAQEQRRVARVQVRMAQLQADQEEQQIQNAKNLLQPLLESELSFASRACELTGEQRNELVRAGKELLEKLAQDYVKKERDPNRRNRIMFGGAFVQRGGIVVGGQSIDFEQEIENAILAMLGEIVTDEQLAAFKSEREQRREFQQQVVVDALVVKLEESLYLADVQREKITDALAENWDAKWAPNLAVLEQYSNYMPALPDNLVVPHLTASQKLRWNAMMKISSNSGLHLHHNRFPAIRDIQLTD